MTQQDTNTSATEVKVNPAERFRGGVIMDVVTVDQALIAQDAGAVAVMALERVPADIRAQGGVARMSDPGLIEAIMNAVGLPVMAKVRIGHFVEAQILQALGVDFVDESEVLTPADESFHIDKRAFSVPFVCGATNIGEALRRIGEGAVMIRTKGEAGTGDVVEAVRHARSVLGEIRAIQVLPQEQLMTYAKDHGAPFDLVQYVHDNGKLPVPNFAAGGIATPADAALMMQLGVEGVFVGSGIFKSAAGETDKGKRHSAWLRRAEAIVKATTHFDDPAMLAKVSKDLGDAMVGINIDALADEDLLAKRGW